VEIKLFKKELGDYGEKIAAKYLSKNGYRIISTNYRCRFGEIDIVSKYKDVIVFIEVKTRRNTTFGRPIESINTNKIRHLIKTINFYINENKLFNYNFRIDAIEIIFDKDNKIHINHIENIIH